MAIRKRWKVDLSIVDPTWADWDVPVALKISSYRTVLIENPAQALTYLANRWPAKRGADAEAAMHICSQVLRRKVSKESSRLVFIQAAIQAGILDPD
jgi:hypothetical protein